MIVVSNQPAVHHLLVRWNLLREASSAAGRTVFTRSQVISWTERAIIIYSTHHPLFPLCQNTNTMLSLQLPPLITMMLIVFLGFGIRPSEAFSTAKISSRRLGIGGRSRVVDPTHLHSWGNTTCIFAVFRDDDCEDLCPDIVYGDDSVAATTKMEEYIAVDGRLKINNFAQRSPRHSRALWWPADSEPDACVSCEGSGEMACRFCGGTSMMSAIGGNTDALFYEGIGKDCPVCNDGMEACTKCAGTGFVFMWSKSMNRTDSFQP
jgi:hypothetical protein